MAFGLPDIGQGGPSPMGGPPPMMGGASLMPGGMPPMPAPPEGMPMDISAMLSSLASNRQPVASDLISQAIEADPKIADRIAAAIDMIKGGEESSDDEQNRNGSSVRSPTRGDSKWS